ncbi:MAG: type II toxin-antitoxin system RelE/ParE family toxin [Candidatus Nanoarchaeia archaeon]
MPYEVILMREAERFLKKCDKSIRDRILDKFEGLRINPRLGKPLTANLAGLLSLRIGDYRAIYQIKDTELLVMVIRVGHRKDIYD